ncbi:hypothetical protein SPB21_02635 [Leptothoe sp. ISB3NOV94-8A]
MSATNYKTTFLDKIENMITTLGGTVLAMAEPTNFEEHSIQLLDVLGNNLGSNNQGGGRYVRLDPRVKEWNNLSVISGQTYTLSSIPQEGNCLVHLLGNPGKASSYTLRIYFESPAITKPIAERYFNHPQNEDYSASLTSTGTTIIPQQLIVPAVDGQIWASRSGSYSSSIYQTDLWVLGYWPL